MRTEIALAKLCPFGMNVIMAETRRCSAVECMAWISEGKDAGYCRLIHPIEETDDMIEYEDS